jgi:hypothetical protein
MKRPMLALGALFLLGVSGCLRTYHVEQHNMMATELSTNGTCASCSHSDRNEREWTGPWISQPCRAQP